MNQWPPQDPYYTPQPERRKSWPRRHPVLTVLAAIVAFIILLVIVAVATGGGSKGIAAKTTPVVSSDTPAPIPSDSSTPAPVTEQLSMGQSAGLSSGDTPAGDIILDGLKVTTWPADPEFGSKPKHGYFVNVGVTTTADPGYSDGLSIYSGDFYVVSSYGQHFNEGEGNSYDALKDSSDELPYTNLAAGEAVSGRLVFDVPSRHGVIAYSPNSDGQPIAEWKF